MSSQTIVYYQDVPPQATPEYMVRCSWCGALVLRVDAPMHTNSHDAFFKAAELIEKIAKAL